MTGTNISGNTGYNLGHNDTYYGNGCENDWEGSKVYYGGSIEACSIRLINTYDDETQEIGTLYSFHAVTSGSGDSISIENSIAPDTFCPLGWQLPYGGTGGDYYDQSKSWYYLFVQYVNPLVSNQENARKFQSYPLSYVLNGTMGVSTGGKTLYFATHNGYYTSNTTASATQYDWMVVTRYGFKTAEVTGKASQTALRCVHRFSILS